MLGWLNNNTFAGEAIVFSLIYDVNLLRVWGRVQPAAVHPDQPFKCHLLQNRPGMFSDLDRALMSGEKPPFVKYAGRHRDRGNVADDLNVPLISVFSFEQYDRARKMLNGR